MCKLVKLFDYLIDLYIFENFFKVLFSLFEQWSGEGVCEWDEDNELALPL